MRIAPVLLNNFPQRYDLKYTKSNPLKSDCVSFSAKNKKLPELMTREEYDKYWIEIKEKIDKIEGYHPLKCTFLSVYNLDIAQRFLDNPKLRNNKFLISDMDRILRTTEEDETRRIKREMLDYLIQDEDFGQDKDYTKFASFLVRCAIKDPWARLAQRILLDKDYSHSPAFYEQGTMLIESAHTTEQERLLNQFLDYKKIASSEDILYQIRNDIIKNSLNKNEVQAKIRILDKLLGDDRLSGDEESLNRCLDIIEETLTQEESETKCAMAEKILSDERLYNNKEVLEKSLRIIQNTKTKEAFKIKSQLIKQILDNEKQNSDPNTLANCLEVISYANNEHSEKIANFILQNETLYKSSDLCRAAYALRLVEDENTAQSCIDFINKVFSDERLLNNKNFMSNLPDIMLMAKEKDALQIMSEAMDKILNDKNLSKNKTLLNNLGEIISHTYDTKRQDVLYAILDKRVSKDRDFIVQIIPNILKRIYDTNAQNLAFRVIDEDRFFENISSCHAAEEIIAFHIKDEADMKRRIALIQDKDLTPIEINFIIRNNNTDIERLKKINRRIGAKNIDKIKSNLSIAYDFASICKKKSIEDLSLDEQVEFLSELVRYNVGLYGAVYDDFLEFFPLLPQNQEEYCKIARKLAKLIEEQGYCAPQNNWIDKLNSIKDTYEHEQVLQSIAFDFRRKDEFEDNLRTLEKSGISLPDNRDIEIIRQYIKEYQESQPFLPVTKFPSASRINEAIKEVRANGSTNIKGVYKDKKGLIILKFNEIEDWEEIGFSQGTTSDNVKFFVHGFNSKEKLASFGAYCMPNSDAVISTSYAVNPKEYFRFFKAQGVVLNCDTNNIHSGGACDSGTGDNKTIETFKQDYIYNYIFNRDRAFISDLIKKALRLSDSEYIDFIQENQNRQLSDMDKITQKKFSYVFKHLKTSAIRLGNRGYNEILISNPYPPMAVFAYDISKNSKIGNPIKFLNRECVDEAEKEYYVGEKDNLKSPKERTEFLREYALLNDIPFVVFGD